MAECVLLMNTLAAQQEGICKKSGWEVFCSSITRWPRAVCQESSHPALVLRPAPFPDSQLTTGFTKLLIILLQKLSARLHPGQGEIIIQTIASQRWVRYCERSSVLTPASLASPHADGEQRQSRCLFPSHLFLLSAGRFAPPECRSTGLPGHHADPRVPTPPQHAFVTLQDKICPRKSSPV